jgi:hypothetical protein
MPIKSSQTIADRLNAAQVAIFILIFKARIFVPLFDRKRYDKKQN